MAEKSRGLGRGFDSLIPNDFDETILLDSEDRIQKLPLGDVKPNNKQPRRSFDKTAIEELATSIKRYGVLQPLIVSPIQGGKYELVAGERRWRAAQIAGLDKIPAIVRKREELERLEVALIENVQRVDLSPLEQAISIERLHQQFNISYKSIAERLGKALPTIHNTVRLLQLPEAALEALQSGKISEGHARAILALKEQPDGQSDLLDQILKKQWSVRQAEQYVVSSRQTKTAKGVSKHKLEPETPATRVLGKKLGTKVTLRRMAKGGRLEIHYKDDKDLENLLNKISKN